MSNSNTRPYATLSSRYLWQSRWYNVRQDQLKATNGHEFTYTVVECPGAVWVVPVTSGGEIVLINQYRYTVDAWCLEVPAGSIDPGQTPVGMAARELREEIGGTAQHITPITDFYTISGIGNEVANIVLATGVTLGKTAHEPTEYITVRPMPVDTVLDMARTGAIKDGPSALAILLCEPAIRRYLAEQNP
ncbi:MAG: NUDIX hydrolase [Anaerolineae bacterium]|nr:NUDIX hydrolase [Anaerolineae bacterium]